MITEIGKNISVLLCSLLLCTVCAEFGLRAFEYWGGSTTVFELTEAPPLPSGAEVRLGDLLRVSEYKEIVYELRPQLNHVFLGVPVKTSAAGFRSQAVPLKKPENTLRVLGLGDSLMFAWGVREEESYLARLIARLNSRHAKLRWELINTAVPGYNTTLEVATLKHKGLAYQADVVVLGFVESNDLELPHFVRQREAVWRLHSSYLYDLLKGRLVQSDLVSSLARPTARQQDSYKNAKGLSSLREALGELQELSHRHGFSVIVYAHEALSKELKDVFSEFDFTLLEAWPELQRSFAGSSADEYKRSDLVLSQEDPHPSAKGHAIAAGLLQAAIEQLSLVEKK